MRKLNKLLDKQIRKNLESQEEVPEKLWKLLEAVNASYNHYERDRKLLERAMNLSSEEIRISYEKLAVQTQLEQSNHYLQQFTSIASHDLKAPLRTIGSFTQLLKMKMGTELDEEANEYMGFIVGGVKRMQALLDDLMTFAKIGTEKKQKKLVDFNMILESVLRNLNHAIVESEASISLEGTLPKSKTISFQVTQLFQNLIGNALKFRGESNPLIQISCKREAHHFLIAVQDNGIGMNTDQHQKAFEAFSRLSNGKEIPGSGLGLSICKKIVEGWGGKIWFDSLLNKGTTFYFTLPISSSPSINQSEECTLVSSSNNH